MVLSGSGGEWQTWPMLADIDADLVEQIVVYKVDRLTRSLSDFAKLVERLEAAGAVFVSVTPSCAKTRPS